MSNSYISDLRHRRSIRLQNYDYTKAGAYFVTLCTVGRQSIFGEVADSEIELSDLGSAVIECWTEIPEHYPSVDVDAFTAMPNHVHGILIIRDWYDLVDASQGFTARKPSLGSVVGSFKSAATKRINELRGTPGEPVWQRNYYKHIIRDERELDHIREYIYYNLAH